MSRRTPACALLTLFSTVLLAVAPTPAAASSTESSFVSLVNRERTSRGLRAEQVASDLVAVARRHSARMASQGRIFHNSRLGSEASNWEEIGENVGRGFSVGRIHSAFMNSASHRANILERNDNVIGVGVVKGKDGRIYVTQIFVRRKMSSRSTATPRPAYRPTIAAPPAVHAAPAPVRRPKPPKTRAVEVLVRMVHFD